MTSYGSYSAGLARLGQVCARYGLEHHYDPARYRVGVMEKRNLIESIFLPRPEPLYLRTSEVMYMTEEELEDRVREWVDG